MFHNGYNFIIECMFTLTYNINKGSVVIMLVSCMMLTTLTFGEWMRCNLKNKVTQSVHDSCKLAQQQQSAVVFVIEIGMWNALTVLTFNMDMVVHLFKDRFVYEAEWWHKLYTKRLLKHAHEFLLFYGFKLLWPNCAIWCNKPLSPLPEATLTHCQLDHYENNLTKIYSKFKVFFE